MVKRQRLATGDGVTQGRRDVVVEKAEFRAGRSILKGDEEAGREWSMAMGAEGAGWGNRRVRNRMGNRPVRSRTEKQTGREQGGQTCQKALEKNAEEQGQV